MNGVHDMGGMMNFGPVVAEKDEPTFHAEWEGRVFALSIAAGATGSWNVDTGRRYRESIDPPQYLSASYYEIWLAGLERLVTDFGLATERELHTGVAAGSRERGHALSVDNVPVVTLGGGSRCDRTIDTPALFAVGDSVMTRNINPDGHTRLPRYARAKGGVVERVHGAHVFADSHAHGMGENPLWLYTVRFTSTELWGEDADATLSISIDAWESYLERR